MLDAKQGPEGPAPQAGGYDALKRVAFLSTLGTLILGLSIPYAAGRLVVQALGGKAAGVLAAPPAFALVESLDRLGLKGERLVIPGLSKPLPAWRIEGPKNQPPVLLVPGWGDSATHLLAPYASWLAKERQVWVVDLPGQRDGAPGLVGMGPSESLILGEAIAYLAKRHGGKISVMGLSMGGSAAIAAVAQHPSEVVALVTDGAFLNPSSGMKLGLQESLGAWGFGFLAQWGANQAAERLAKAQGSAWPEGATAEEAAPKLKGLPWFLIHGGQDHVVAVRDAEKLSKLGDGILWTVTQADHCSEAWTSPLAKRGDRYRQAVQKALSGESPGG